MRSISVCVLTLSMALQVAGQANALPMQAAPMEFSCEVFPRDLSEAKLIARYGRDAVRLAPVVGSDDGPQDGTVVFPDQDDMRLEVVWWDAESKTRPHWIRTRGNGRRWRTPDGITVGMDLLAIEQANGRPFRLAALSTEGQGVVRSWGKGRFRASEADGCRVNISLLATGGHTVDPLLARQVLRGREFSSGHPAMQALNPRAVSMSVTHTWR